MAETRDILWRFLGDSKGLNRAAKDAEKGLGGVSGAMGLAGKAAAGLGLALGGAQMLNYAGDAVQLALAAEEVDSKFDAVFGAAGDFKQALSEWGDVAGVTDTQAFDLAATFGNLALSAGMGEDATRDLTTDVAILAGDLGSFNDADPAEVFRTLNSAILTTEREGLKKFGIALGEAEVKQRALELATAAGRDEVSQADRALASYQLVSEKAGKAVGDLARTSESGANKQRQMKAAALEAQEAIGLALLPAYEKLIKVANDKLIPALEDMAPMLGDLAIGFGDVVEAAGPLIDAAGWVLELRNAVAEFGVAAQESQSPWDRFTGQVSNFVTGGTLTNLQKLWQHTKDELDRVFDSSEKVTGSFGNVRTRIEEVASSVYSKLDPALVDMGLEALNAKGGIDGITGALDTLDERLARRRQIVISGINETSQQIRDKLVQSTPVVPSTDKRMASGGIVAGRPGQPVSIVAHAGERIVPQGSGSGESTTININIGVAGNPYETARVIADLLTRYEQTNGTRISGVSL